MSSAVLTVGSRDEGPDGPVRRWQRVLSCLGCADQLGAAGVDGDFGGATKRATGALQTRLGLAVTGVADAATQRLAGLELVQLAAALLGA